MEEKNLNVESEGDRGYGLSVVIPGLDDDNSLAAKMKPLSSKIAQASPSQEEERSTLAMQKTLASAQLVKQALSEATTPVLKSPNIMVPTMKTGPFFEIKEKLRSTVPTTSGGILKDEGTIDANERRTRKLRSAAPHMAVTKTDPVVEQPYLTKEIRTYLEPLTSLDGVRSEINYIQGWYEEWTMHCNVTKIAEGSFGSVFKMSDKEGLQEPTIGKLMPLRPKSGKGSRKPEYTHIMDAVGEIRLLETMSQVPGFVEFRSAEVLVGELPKPLKREYRTYKARCKSNKGSFCELRYPDDQTWVFIEMGNAGTELEDALLPESEENMILDKDGRGQWTLGVQHVRDIFWGVAEALANGEEAQEFEHRDMHFSNICIQRKQIQENNGYLLIPSDTNIEVTLIDYTLSRATLLNGKVVCNRMVDQEIFFGQDDLQFDVYRWMREEMPGQDLRSKQWEAFVPMTNVLWLYHLLEKLMLLTTQRELCGNERTLWESLNELKAQINPNNRQSRCHTSAIDIVNYARDCVADLNGSKESIDRKNLSDFPEDTRSSEYDLSAKFECVRI